MELRLHQRPRQVERLVEVHHERDRPAADERQPHVLPVGVGGVLHDRPALQRRLRDGRVGVEQEPIARLPDRRLPHVADRHGPFARARERDRDPLLLVVRGEGQHGERLLELRLEPRVGELHAGDGVERQRPQAVGGEHGEKLLLDGLVLADLNPPLLHAHDRAGDGRGGVEFHPLAAKPAEELAERRVVGEVDGEGAERLRDRIAGGVAHRRRTAAGIEHHHALEQVVDVGGGELHLHGRLVDDRSPVLVVAHARGEEHHALQRQRGVGGGGGDRREGEGRPETGAEQRGGADGHGGSPRGIGQQVNGRSRKTLRDPSGRFLPAGCKGGTAAPGPQPRGAGITAPHARPWTLRRGGGRLTPVGGCSGFREAWS